MLRACLFLLLLPLTQLTAQGESSPADQDHSISIFFGGGSYYIHSEEANKLRNFLDEIGDLSGYEIELQGHTDDIGNRAYNLRLSEYRGLSIREWLINYPVDPAAIQTLPFGEDAPSFDNDTWEGKLSNRRVDVILKRVPF